MTAGRGQESDRNFKSVEEAFLTAMDVASHSKIWSLDLRTVGDSSELSRAVLRCLLNSFGYEEEGKSESEQANRFFLKLLWSVEWNGQCPLLSFDKALA